MSSRVLRWLIFSILFSLLPLGLDYLMALSHAASGSSPGFSEIIGKGELCLLAVALSAVGLGEIQGTPLKDERTGIVLGGASLINLTVSIALYVMMKSSKDPMAIQMAISTIFFISTLIVSTSCISFSEVAGD